MAEGNLNVARPRGEAHESGAGPTLLLLHGLGGTWHIWKPLLPLLEKHHRVVAMTLPGHFGGPPMPAGQEPSVDLMADVLVAELDARGIARPHVAGNSLGGWLALELARRGRAASVTALSPAGGWQSAEDYRKVERPFRIVFAILAVLIFLTRFFLRFAWVRRKLNAQAMQFGDRMPVADFLGAMQSMRNTTMLPGLLTSMRDKGGLKPFEAGTTPIRIAWCEHDRVIPFEAYGRPLQKLVGGSQHLLVRGVGHVPMYDDPEQVAQVVLDTARLAGGAA